MFKEKKKNNKEEFCRTFLSQENIHLPKLFLLFH